MGKKPFCRKHEGLQLCEYDSMVWVHFCQMWQLCALSLCICESVEEEEQRTSHSTKSHFTEVGYQVKKVTLMDVVFCGGV